MYRNVCIAVLMSITVLMIVACTGNGKHLTRQGSKGDAGSSMEGVSKFTLKNGQKGKITINETNYAFELLRINSQNNVTIVLQNGKKFHLPRKSAKSVKFNDGLGSVVFELDRVVQDAAIIHVRKLPLAIAKPAGETDPSETFFQKQSDVERIRLAVAIVQDTTVKLSIDGQVINEIPLPKATEVNWQAETSVDIELPEPHKARLEINGTCYKSSSDVKGLHLFVIIGDGKLTVEYR